MQIKVDQSGKIEHTNMDTVLAFANDINYSILIRAIVKRRCIQQLRRRRIGNKIIVLRLFSVGLFLLLRDILKEGAIVMIDTEYTGREGDIKGMLLRMAKHANVELNSHQIQLGYNPQ